MKIISQSFKTECENLKVWKIENYEIVKRRCLGFAGAPYYPVYLCKNDKELDYLTFTEDSTCILKFKPTENDSLIFDICEMKLLR